MIPVEESLTKKKFTSGEIDEILIQLLQLISMLQNITAGLLGIHWVYTYICACKDVIFLRIWLF